MESDGEPYDEKELIRAVDHFDWSDSESSEWANTPGNDFYRFQPPTQYAKYYRLLRVVLDSQQKSPRCLALTSLMLKIKLNNYYALMLRKDCIVQNSLNKDLVVGEICFVNHLLEINSKQYQLWTYKKFLFEKFKPQEADLQLFYNLQTSFLESLLEIDSKNYHVWDYKLWLTLYFAKEREQLEWSQYQIFRASKIDKTMQGQLKDTGFTVHSIHWSNCYSLWSFRYNLAKLHLSKVAPQSKSKFQKQQVMRVKQWLSNEENLCSECGWTYLTGLAVNAQHLGKELQFQIYEMAKQIYHSNAANRFAGNASLQMLQLLNEKYHFECEQEMKQLLASLKVNDPVREKYYNYLIAH